MTHSAEQLQILMAAQARNRLMTKKGYYDRKRSEIWIKLMKLAYLNPPTCTAPRLGTDRTLAHWAYEYRWRETSMGRKRMIEIGRLLGIEVLPDDEAHWPVKRWLPWGGRP